MDSTPPRRRFTRRERAALFLAADGKCAKCGRVLDNDWHADHTYPFSRGGATDVTNGQALCRACNLKKGQYVSHSARSQEITPREWQQDFFEHFWAEYDKGVREYLLEACPGAGKTVANALVMLQARALGISRRFIVCVPTEPLKQQWAEALAPLGIHLNWAWRPGQALASDYDGIVVCYQTVASAPLSVRMLCDALTMMVGDEWHHIGDDNTWGKAAREAFAPVGLKLLGSGTPFRTDQNEIPFVRYREKEGHRESWPHFSYGYGKALQSEPAVVRPVVFGLYDGVQSWWDGEWHERRLSDTMPQRDEGRAIGSAISMHGNWLPGVLREANLLLDSVRADGHPTAGALVVCDDQRHARDVADFLTELTGEKPALVISDVANAADAITQFAKNSRRWIVSVYMVSEGVDIKRLRIGVFATRTRTELFFRQFVGRVLRMLGLPGDETAHIFLPNIRSLVELAERIAKERNHSLFERDEDARPGGDREPWDRDAPIFAYGPNSDPEHRGWVDGRDGSHMEEEIKRRVASLKADNPGIRSVADPLVALIVNAMLKSEQGARGAHGAPGANEPAARSGQNPPGFDSRTEEKKRLRNTCKRLIGVYVRSQGGDPSYAQVNNWLNRVLGVTNVEECTVPQLHKRITLIKSLQGDGKMPNEFADAVG